MKTDYHYQRVESLWAEIARLEGVIVECEREALSVSGSESDCTARVAREMQARLDLDRVRREHGILAHFLAMSMRPARAA